MLNLFKVHERMRSQADSRLRNMVATSAARHADQIGLNLYDGSPVSQYLGWLLDFIDKQGVELNFWRSRPQNRDPPPPPIASRSPSPPPIIAEEPSMFARHQVLHRVQCDRRSHKHGSGIFLDPPMRRGVELNGLDHIWDLTKYLCDNVDIVFVVFQDYQCDGALSSRLQLERSKNTRTSDISAYQILPDDEYIYVVSDTLRAALIEVAECSPFDSEADGEMMAPYLFVYHQRQKLKELAEKRQGGDFALHVTSLLTYIETRYGPDYEEADAKFAKGVVTPAHLAKLWVPNQILVAKKDGHYFAYVLKEWPSDRR